MGKTRLQGAGRLLGVLAVLLPLACAAPARAQPPPVGGLSQLVGPAGCTSFDGSSGTCATDTAVQAAESAVLSPDGAFLYLSSSNPPGSEPSLAVFSRNGGTLTPLSGRAGCLTADGSGGSCTQADGLTSVGEGRDLAITSDGRWAYLVAQGTGGSTRPTIMLFSRDPSSGALTQLPGLHGCISDDGSSNGGAGTCQTDSHLRHPVTVTTSPDDKYVYVGDRGSPSGIRVYSRDPNLGTLTPIQCLQESPAASGCTTVRDAGDASSLAISSDGTHVYSADKGPSGVSVFDRDPTTGLLTQKSGDQGCVSSSGNDNAGHPTCSTARGLGGASGLALAPDGQNLYVSATSDNGFAIFAVNGDGTLTQPSGTGGCLTMTGASGGVPGKCAMGRAIGQPGLPLVAPNGRTLYVPSMDSSHGGVAIFALDPSSGTANQLAGPAGCVTADGSSGGASAMCTSGRAVAGGTSIAIDPSSTFAYLAAQSAHAVAAFSIQPYPGCAPTTVQTPYATPITIPLTCTDADGEPVTRTIVRAPADGTLGPIDQTAGTVTYTPSSSFTTSDSFTFVATDGTNTSSEALVTIRAAQPKLTKVSQSRSKWRRRQGTTFSFKLNEAATVTLTFEDPKPGRRVNGACMPVTTANAHHRSCTRMRALGRVTVAGHAGLNRIRFKGRLRNGRKLRAGDYAVWFAADNAAGSSHTKQLKFTILAG